ncbi:MAG: ABC transporter ATP-binding protein [Proteobacteria bacterium]|nr:ABC transporter ATP-binding protein [Pseudomonadota bacterium]MCG2739172.1 ABC transporter ATP-binding protein [Syntrophaceae bacterium]MBU1743910.1 ABC transporter ATP-binding protein [Pseudomonadota bacterium]MBU1964485.1 ABC transporter ATP-binding protein [Pseudomonadota bacterium]MBU4372517.1 ABC transporter ATP-binding protein [Pseudomonadota bacterium]
MSLLVQNLGIWVDGVAHLSDISLEFQQGRLYTILGQTLSGKTTLLRTIAGLQSPQKGTLTLHGQDFLELPVWKRRVAMVYQQFINYPHLDVLANVAFPLLRAGVPRAEARQRAREILGKIGLANFENRRPSTLSGGQQQRVALARALVKRAEILLLDEPLVNLDYKLREQLRDEFQNIFAGQDDAIVIYTTTDPDEAIQLGHELIVMDEGAVIQQGKPLEVFNAPAMIRCAEIIYNPPMNIFNGAIQRGEILLQGGVRLPVPWHMGHLPEGTYRFGLSTADISIGGNIGAEVELSEISGSQTILHLRGAIGSFIVYEAGVYHYSMGSTVQVGLDPGRIFTFAVDGKLISAPAATAGQER